MDRMVMQASQKSLVMLADSLACGSLSRTCSSLSGQSPFATHPPAASAGASETSNGSGTYLQHLRSGSSVMQHPQAAPMQQLPPYRTLQRGPHLPQLRTLRSKQLTGRLYSVQSGSVQTIEEPIIVACSWLGAKQGPFAK